MFTRFRTLAETDDDGLRYYWDVPVSPPPLRNGSKGQPS